MVHLFRLRNSLHGRNKLGVFLQSFNSLSDPSHWPLYKSEFYFLPSLSPILQILHRTQTWMQWSVVVIQVMDAPAWWSMCNVNVRNVSPWCAVLDSICSPHSDQGTSSDPINTDTIPTEMRIEEEWRNTNISVWLKIQIVFVSFPRRKYFSSAK